jgi:hypothetical protein
MIKPQLTSAEAAFSKLDFKPNTDIAYYIDKGALYSYSIQNKTIKNYYNNLIQFLTYN